MKRLQNSSSYIFGINDSHIATAALLKDGEVIACASEERFTRKKGQWGMPREAIKYCLSEARIHGRDVERVYLGFVNPTLAIHDTAGRSNLSKALKIISPAMNTILQWSTSVFPSTYDVYQLAYNGFFRTFVLPSLQHERFAALAGALGTTTDRISAVDHHTAHAYGAYYSFVHRHFSSEERILVVTNDGIGDDSCSKIFVVVDDNWKEVASTPNAASLGWLYQYVTEFLGMKPNEHEYKVMGLAPYAWKAGTDSVYGILQNLMWVDGLIVRSRVPMLAFGPYVEKHLRHIRFDAVAGGIQKFAEHILTVLVSNAMGATGTDTVVCGGGVFMNVKANMEIGKLPNLKKLMVVPSCGDESTAIGAAFYGWKQHCTDLNKPIKTKPIKTLYLGPQFSEKETEKSITRYKKKYSLSVSRLQSPAKEVARLIASGAIVARCCGRMEFGARALGNRSILAHPGKPELIRILNEQVKGRDFWMPFAPVILAQYADKYLVNPKGIESPFMMQAFETTQLAHTHLVAAVHPYDFTARPQILYRDQNPGYYDIIDEFRKITGIGALLNTSFNLHGEPIVCTLEDALSTLVRSGLRYLLINNDLIMKQ